LSQNTEQVRLQADASSALRQQLETMTGDYNYVLGKKYGFPSQVQVLDDVTKLLPDDTWLTQLEVKSAPKGKEPRRELLLRGESANAGRLVSLLEDSKVFVEAAPRSPTTKIQPGPGEIFDLGAQVAPTPPPLPLQLASTPVDPAAPPVVAPEAAAAPAPTPPPAAAPPVATAAPAASAPAVAAPAVSQVPVAFGAPPPPKEIPPGMTAPRDMPPPPGSVNPPSAAGPPTVTVGGEQVVSGAIPVARKPGSTPP